MTARWFQQILFVVGLLPLTVSGQPDSSLLAIRKNSEKYIATVSAKAQKYYAVVTSKTEKTLTKLSNWETKIKNLLEKVNPAAAERLFASTQITFSTLLVQYQKGKLAADGYVAAYNSYSDKLTTTLHYLDEKKGLLDKKIVAPLRDAKEKMLQLNQQLASTEALSTFIKERKKQLVQEAIQYIGKSKYLQKINKEAFYYFETLRNYKEIFSDPKKVEMLVLGVLKKFPAFNEFIERNSVLAGLFGNPGAAGNPNGTVGFLQSRISVQSFAQTRMSAGGPNPQQFIQQAVQLAKGQLSKLAQQISQAGGNNSDFEIPNFTPNSQRSKKFLQKIELSGNIQSTKHNSVFPVTSDFGFSAGYKPNDKLIIGLGGSYKVGFGSGFNQIKITHQGLGIRSFADWKLRGQFYISGGYEQNYFAEIRNIDQLKDFSAWKASALLGMSKKYKIGKKKKGEMKLLYDFLSQSKVPATSAFLFRVGFGL